MFTRLHATDRPVIRERATSPRLSTHVPRLWALWAASRPSQLALIVLVYALGVGMTTGGPSLVVGEPTANGFHEVSQTTFLTPVAVGAAVLVLVAVAVHYANEYADADTDALTEPTPFSGGSGALAETGLPASFLGTATAVASVVAALAGGTALFAGLLAFDAAALLGLILVTGLAYSLQPVALARRGVGEVINASLGGLLLPVYGVAVVAAPAVSAPLAVVPFTLVVGCNLLATHWPDRKADATVGKDTLAVRWSPSRIRHAYATLACLAAVATAGLWLAGVFPTPVAVAHLVAAPFLAWGWTTLTRQRTPFPAVAAMVALALASTAAWWWMGIG